MKREIRTSLALDGEKKFKDGLAALNSALKVNKSELKALREEYKLNGGSIENLIQQQKLLKDNTDTLKNKVDALGERVAKGKDDYKAAAENLEKMRKEFGENSKEAELAEQNLRKTEKTLDNYTTQLASARGELARAEKAMQDFNEENAKGLKPLEKMSDELNNSRNHFKEFSEKLKSTNLGKSFEDAKEQVKKLDAALSPIGQKIADIAAQAAKISFKAAEKSAEAFGNVLKTSLGGAADFLSVYTKAVSGAALAVGGAATALGKQSIESYAQYEQLVGGVETLFGAGGQSIEEYAKSVGKSVDDVKDEYNKLIKAQDAVIANSNNAYKTAGMSANEYIESVTAFSASLLQSLGGNTELAAEAANNAIIDMSDNANKLGTDISSIQNAYQGFAKQNYTMLDNLKLGYGGTKEEMQRLLEDAEKLSGQKYSIDSLKDVYEAVHVVQTEMGITGTTAKEASATIEGSVSAMRSAWQNLVTGLADDNADLEKLTSNLIESVLTAGSNVIPRIKVTITGITKAASKMLVDNLPGMLQEAQDLLLESGIPDMMNNLIDAIPQYLTMFTDTFNNLILNIADKIVEYLPIVTDVILPTLVQQATNLAVGFAEKIPQFATQVADGAVVLFQGLIDGLNEVSQKLLPKMPAVVKNIGKMLTDNLPIFFNSSLEFFSGLLTALDDSIKELMPMLPKMIEDMCNTLLANIDDIIDTGYDMLIGLVDGLSDAMPVLMEKAPEIITKLVDALSKPESLTKLAQAGVDMGVAIMEGMPKIGWAILNSVGTLAANITRTIFETDWLEIGKDIVKGILEGFVSVDDWIEKKVKQLCGKFVKTITDVFQIHSPSRLMRDKVGVYLGQGIAVGLEESMPDVQKIVNKSMPKKLETSFDIDAAYRRVGGYEDAMNYAQAVNNSYSNESSIVINIENANMTTREDITTLAEELDELRRRQNAGKGVYA